MRSASRQCWWTAERITETNQKAMRDKIDADVAAAIDKTGCAQLIFDDYGRAIRRSQGGTLHSMLYRLLVDSEAARDTGALLVARSGDMLDLNFSGSPLISRAQAVVLPTLTEEDAAALGVELDDLKDRAGESTWLARRFMNVDCPAGSCQRSGAPEQRSTTDRRGVAPRRGRDSCRRSICRELGRHQLRGPPMPRQHRRRRAISSPRRSSASPTSWTNFSCRTLDGQETLSESVQRFADLLAGVEDAIWVDRYLFSEPSRVCNFLAKLRRLTTARLRLLVSDDRDRFGFARDISSALDGVDNVEVRFMERHDRRRLHDRHLVLPASRSGFVLPTAGVILGADDPGSAVSVPMRALPINYADCWARGSRVHPRPD